MLKVTAANNAVSGSAAQPYFVPGGRKNVFSTADLKDRVSDCIDKENFYYIASKLPGRMRIKKGRSRNAFSGMELMQLLELLPDNMRIKISKHSGSLLVFVHNSKYMRLYPETLPEKPVANPIPGKIVSYAFPFALRAALATLRAIPYIAKGLYGMLSKGKLDLNVLDAAALSVCLIQRDFRSLSSIVFFFALGEYLADWTRKKSHSKLADSLALNIESVWLKCGDTEIMTPLAKVLPGDLVVVRSGAVIPVDGTVETGEAMVNQSSMTGEPLPIPRIPGQSVFAGTMLEEGELVVRVVKVGGETRISSILRKIDESEAAKAAIQSRYEHIADSIVPYNFLLSGLVFALTRDLRRAGSVLLVDYSCALRLATPLAVLTCLREAASHGVLIKGGKFAEALSQADTVIFDKTGTLTEAQPTVVEVIPFNGYERDYILKSAACLEEHFPHPVGRAVVAAAELAKLSHREEHTQVELIVAHGIASRLHGKRVLVGSEHFLLEDSQISITPEQREIISKQAGMGRSVLYVSFDARLGGIILIEDKIRPNAAAAIKALRQDGIKRVIMLTGDGELTAASIAAQAGIDEFRARLLPEHKAAFVQELRAAGHTVLMLGDGINDSPALSAANVGVSMSGGADLTKEVADVVLTRGDIMDLLTARKLSRRTMRRIKHSFNYSLAFNSVFLLGGLFGVVGAGLAALLHNATTAVIALSCMQNMLPPALPQAAPATTEKSLTAQAAPIRPEATPMPKNAGMAPETGKVKTDKAAAKSISPQPGKSVPAKLTKTDKTKAAKTLTSGSAPKAKSAKAKNMATKAGTTPKQDAAVTSGNPVAKTTATKRKDAKK